MGLGLQKCYFYLSFLTSLWTESLSRNLFTALKNCTHFSALLMYCRYHIESQKMIKYTELQEEKRAEHRLGFTQYLLSNQHIIASHYQEDQKVATLNSNSNFPLFHAFNIMAKISSGRDEPLLARVIAQELFYFGYMVPPMLPPAHSTEIASRIPMCRQEGAAQVTLSNSVKSPAS